MNIEQIHNMWDEDCLIDDNHLGNHSIDTAKLHSKYIRILTGVKLKLTKMNADRSELRKNKFRYYRGELSREELQTLGWEQWQGVKPLKSELEHILDGDQDLVRMQIKVEYFTTMIYLLESILGQIKARDWQLKNAITWKQFLAGN